MEDLATSVSSSFWASLNSWFTSTVFFVLLNLMIATIVFTSNLPTNNNHQQQHHQEQEEQKQPQIPRSPSILHRLKSFNFYPQKSQNHSSSDTHYHQHPLEVAATQYVFNQHFDFDSSNPDPNLHQIHPDTHTDTHVPTGLPAHYDFNHMSQETSSTLTGLRAQYGSDHMSQETGSVTGSISTGLQTRYVSQEPGTDTAFEFDPPTHGDIGYEFEPAGDEHTDELQSLDEVYSRLKRGGHDRTQSDGNIQPKPAAKMKKSTSLKVGFSNHEEEEFVEARRPATVKEKKSAARMVDNDDVEVDSRADDFINKFKNDLKLQRIESIMRTKGASRGAGK